jgi:diguanylate cyclase
VAAETLDQARDYAAQAQAEMARRSIPATPENYAVWYSFVAGTNGDLRRHIETLAENHQEFDEFRSQWLFDEFVLPTMASAAIAHAGESLDGIIYGLTGVVSGAGEDAARYGEALESASGDLLAGHEQGPGVLKDIVRTLLDETRAMQDRNQALQERLQESSDEVEALRQKLEDSRREAETDGLTGIANRKRFDRSLRDMAAAAMAQNNALCLLMVDIDFFKKFNDNFGHQLGDQVLRLVGRTLTDSVRDDDLPARYGGEEFGVLLPSAELDKAREIGERIRQQVGAKRIVKRSTGEDLGTITLSIGCSRYVHGEPVPDLVKRADAALYLAKRSGRNRVMTEDDLDRQG